jgi:hypothetical protein
MQEFDVSSVIYIYIYIYFSGEIPEKQFFRGVSSEFFAESIFALGNRFSGE